LENRKFQTRRVIKPQPDLSILKNPKEPLKFRKCPILGVTHNPSEWGLYRKKDKIGAVPISGYKCPYGKIGQKLWVRETWVKQMGGIIYKATDNNKFPKFKWKPSIYMPRKYSRITLEITNIRVERVADITPEDCFREGCSDSFKVVCSAIIWFRELWNSINGKKYPWKLNPFVWVISFKVAKNRKERTE